MNKHRMVPTGLTTLRSLRRCQISAAPFSFYSRAFFSKYVCLLLISFLMVSGCVKEPARYEKAPEKPLVSISSFPEADALFRKDKYWLGGDGASSIDLGNEEVLWLFGDTFVGTDGSGNRKKSVMIRNSIAIQKGYDPAHAAIRFYFRHSKGKPAPFFHSPCNGEVWPSTGIIVRGKLFIFFMKVQTIEKGLGFDVETWHSILIKDRRASPDQWEWTPVDTPPPLPGLPLILSFVFSEKKYLYGFFTHAKTHGVYLCRWPINDFFNEHLLNPSWWCEKRRNWIRAEGRKKNGDIAPLFSEGQMEFTIEWQPVLKKYLLIQSQGFGNAAIGMRTADSVTGPWSSFKPLYSVPEGNRPNLLIYAAKSHPELKGAPVILTYAVNSLDFKEVLSDNRIYFPYFLKGMVVNEHYRAEDRL